MGAFSLIVVINLLNRDAVVKMDLDSTIEAYLPPKKKLRPEKTRQTSSKRNSEKLDSRSRKPASNLSQYRFDPPSIAKADDSQSRSSAKNELERLTELVMEDSFRDQIQKAEPREQPDSETKSQMEKSEKKSKSRAAKGKSKMTIEKKPSKIKSESKTKSASANGRKNRSMVNILNHDVKSVCSQAMCTLKLDLSSTTTEPLNIKLVDYSQKKKSISLDKSEESLWKLSSKLVENFNIDVINTIQSEDIQIGVENEDIKHRILCQHSGECRICRKLQTQLGIDLVKLLQPQLSHLQTEVISCKNGTVPVTGLIYQLRVENAAYDLQQFSVEVVQGFVYFLYSGCLPTPLYEDSLLALKMIAQITCCVSLAELVSSHIDQRNREQSETDRNILKKVAVLGKQDFCNNSQSQDDQFVDSLWIASENEPQLDFSQAVCDQKLDHVYNLESEADLFEDEEEEFFNYLDRTQLNKSLLHVSFTHANNKNFSTDVKTEKLDLADCRELKGDYFANDRLLMTDCLHGLNKNEDAREIISESDLESSVQDIVSTECKNSKFENARTESESKICEATQDLGNDKTAELCSDDVLDDRSFEFEYERDEEIIQSAVFYQTIHTTIDNEKLKQCTTNGRENSFVSNSDRSNNNSAMYSFGNIDSFSIAGNENDAENVNCTVKDVNEKLTPPNEDKMNAEEKTQILCDDDAQVVNPDVVLETEEENDINCEDIASSQSTESLITSKNDVIEGSMSPLIETDDNDDEISIVCGIDLRTRLKMSQSQQSSAKESDDNDDKLCEEKVPLHSLELQNVRYRVEDELESKSLNSSSRLENQTISLQKSSVEQKLLSAAQNGNCVIRTAGNVTQESSQVDTETKNRTKQAKKTKRTEPTLEDVVDFVKKSPHIWCKMLQYKPIHLLSFKNEFEEKNPNFKLKDNLLKSYFDQIGAFCSEKLVSTF